MSTSASIRQSGGSNIVSIPKAVINAMGLSVGSELDIEVKDNQIILTPASQKKSLKALLDGSPASSFKTLPEDDEWLDSSEGEEYP